MKHFVRTLLSPFIRVIVSPIGPKLAARTVAIVAKVFAFHKPPFEGLRFLLDLDNLLYPAQGQLSIKYGDGLHTKHRHLKYHEFFLRNINTGERVLDVGSGNGALAYDMASKVDGTEVVGIEIDRNNYEYATSHYKHPNLDFFLGDALKELPTGQFDVVVLSSFLEHIQDRVGFLKDAMGKVAPRHCLIRVPLFERDWRVPLKRELGLDYRLDPTHYIEYDLETFREEMNQSGLEPTSIEVRWGEIWCVTEPVGSKFA